MHHEGREDSLTVERTDGVGFAAALYVRDRFGLAVGAQIPPLTPPVQPRAASLTVIPAEWDGWWSAIAGATPARYVPPPGGSALGALYDSVRDELIHWVQDQHRESSRVARAYHPDWLSPWIRRSTVRGRHVTEVVPVAGPWSLVVTPRRLLVSVDLMRDHDAMDTLWRDQLSRL